MTTLQKYLPCPFCGKQQTLQVISGQELMGEDQEFWQHSDSFGVVCDASSPDGKGGCGAMGGFKPTEDEAIEAWNTRSALSQQELPQKERTDFMAGYDAGMADAKRMAQQGGQQPVAYITDTWQGPMVWTPEMYNDACTYCDDGEFPVPLYTAAPAPQAHPEVDGGEFVNGVWRGVAAPQPVVNQQMTTVKESLTHQSAQPVAPLTDDQIKSMWAQYCGYPGGILDFARAVREVK